eukprot:scaffold13833_cov108-Phaeocystis_antarctica.AAC.1
MRASVPLTHYLAPYSRFLNFNQIEPKPSKLIEIVKSLGSIVKSLRTSAERHCHIEHRPHALARSGAPRAARGGFNSIGALHCSRGVPPGGSRTFTLSEYVRRRAAAGEASGGDGRPATKRHKKNKNKSGSVRRANANAAKGR